MLDQGLVVCLAQNEDVLHVQLQPYLRQLFGQLTDSKRHIRNLLLGQQPRVLRLLGVRVWVLVHSPFLREALVGCFVVFQFRPIVLLEQRMHDASG